MADQIRESKIHEILVNFFGGLSWFKGCNDSLPYWEYGEQSLNTQVRQILSVYNQPAKKAMRLSSGELKFDIVHVPR